jgi:hypothetical protein
MRKKPLFFIFTAGILFSTLLTYAEDISTKPNLDDDEDDDFVVQPIVILGPDGNHIPAPGKGGPPSFG